MMNCRLRIRTGLSLVAVSLTMLCQSASAEDAKLKVTTFAGPQGLALFVAKDKGIFQKNGLSVDITFTPNSQVLRDGIAKGDFEIAQAGVDNALAMVETAKKDVVIIGGGSNGMNELMVRPEIIDEWFEEGRLQRVAGRWMHHQTWCHARRSIAGSGNDESAVQYSGSQGRIQIVWSGYRYDWSISSRWHLGNALMG